MLPDAYRDLAGRSFLVTGAAGFIGGALVRRLAAYGLDVKGTVLVPEEAEKLRAEGLDAEVLDLAANGDWDAHVDGVDMVFHVAAMFQEVEQNDDAFYQVNEAGTLKLVETAARNGVTRFVHCSTVGVHGDVREIPCTEETPFNPMDVYHKSKLAGELAILKFVGTPACGDMTVTVNRPAMVYGPGDVRMHKLFKMIHQRKFRMIGSGETLAHLGYIEDQVESFLLCAVAPREQVHGESFNIASGDPVTLNDLAAAIAEELGVPLPAWKIPVWPVMAAAVVCEAVCKPLGVKPPLFPRRVGFFTHSRAFDYAKAREKLGYESTWPTRDGVRETIRWYREQGML